MLAYNRSGLFAYTYYVRPMKTLIKNLNLDAQFTSCPGLHGICNMAWPVWYTMSSCWNYIWSMPRSSNPSQKKLVIIIVLFYPLAVMAWPTSFSNKYGSIAWPGQKFTLDNDIFIMHWTVLDFMWIVYRSKLINFKWLRTHSSRNGIHRWKWYFDEN